ncbi:MAG: TetR/AcrR family transcriptional regulator [Cryobacterium sp.]
MSEYFDDLGLRERKRLATRRAIQLAVLTLAQNRGIDKVTIDDISRVAGVSPRTFFNYFASKDAALVGDAPGLGTADDVELFVHGGPDGDIWEQLAVLIAASLERTESDREIHRLRREMMQDSVYLLGVRVAAVRVFEQQLHDVFERRFLIDRPERTEEPGALAQEALLFTMISVAAIRHAWRCWVDGDGSITLSGQVRASFAQVYTMTRRSG